MGTPVDSDKCPVNTSAFELGMSDKQHLCRSWFVYTCSPAVALCVCGVFSLLAIENVPKAKEMKAGRRYQLNPGILNADVPTV